MNYMILIDDFDRSFWEDCAVEFYDYNFYQTWPYQQLRCKESFTKISRFIVLNDSGYPIMMGQVRIKQFANFRIGYIQSGPLIKSKKYTEEFLDEKILILRQELMSKLRLKVLRINFKKSHLTIC